MILDLLNPPPAGHAPGDQADRRHQRPELPEPDEQASAPAPSRCSRWSPSRPRASGCSSSCGSRSAARCRSPPQGYRFNVEFDQATELASQAAGADRRRQRRPRGQRRPGPPHRPDPAVIEIDRQFAPRPADTRAILRQKTLLGETYVRALARATRSGPSCRDGGTLPRAQVAPTVQLDQILSTFDPHDPPGVRDLDAAGRDRAHQPRPAVQRRARRPVSVRHQRRLGARGAATARARRRRRCCTTAARCSRRSAARRRRCRASCATPTRCSPRPRPATRRSPTRSGPSRRSWPRRGRRSSGVERFSVATKPLIDELHPAAVQLTPALQTAGRRSRRSCKTLMQDVAPLTQAARTGFPALQRFLDRQRAVPGAAEALSGPAGAGDRLHQRLPARARRLLRQQHGDHPGHARRRLRQATCITCGSPTRSTPSCSTPYQARPETNRSNPYLEPGGLRPPAQGPAGVRQVPLHQPSAADRLPVAVGQHNFGDRDCVNNCAAPAEVLLHVRSVRSAVRGAGSARKPHDRRVRTFPTFNRFREHGRRYGRHDSHINTTRRSNCDGYWFCVTAGVVLLVAAASAYAAINTYTAKISFTGKAAGTAKKPVAIGYTEDLRRPAPPRATARRCCRTSRPRSTV